MDLSSQKVETDLGALRFTTAEAALLSGAAVPEIGRWLTRGDVSIGDDIKPGRGVSRAFTALQVAQIKCTKRLLDAGLGLSVAAKIALALRKFWNQPNSSNFDGDNTKSRWLLVAPAQAWPAGLMTQISQQVEGYRVVFRLHDDSHSPAALERDSVLAALGDFPVIALNADAFLNRTFADMKAHFAKSDGL